jgi:transposase
MEFENRLRLKYLRKAGIVSRQELSDMTGITLSSVYRILKRIDNKQGVEKKSGSGASPKLGPNDKRRIVGLAMTKPKLSTQKIVDEGAAKGSPQVSSRTIQRYLKSIGWKKLVPLSKPYLTKKMMKQRVDWCKNIAAPTGKM